MAADDRDVPALVRELVTLSRRFRTNAERLHPDLSFVEYSLLSEMAERNGGRARDLTGLYGINKSTISRQVAALQHAGLVVREADPDNARVQLLHPLDHGHELLAHADALMHHEVSTRPQAWSPQEVRALRGLLARYNTAASAVTEDSHT
ncbi:MarR family winged helix-turn-helix transcriptional regulator [Streptomyces sp. NPDC057302]|uniref:MarR family winged helix-turn-helix transcriptional regulator n=1 Tax=Streptomyces sp. NPDC057302 TaxID=3346094 RepID=UPI003636E953